MTTTTGFIDGVVGVFQKCATLCDKFSVILKLISIPHMGGTRALSLVRGMEHSFIYESGLISNRNM